MTQQDIALAGDYRVPLDIVTETVAILGRRGSGKTTTAAVLIEGVLSAGAQALIVDPTDAWWGLRASADGAGDGLPIVVLGGPHGDLPLDAGSGAVLADLAVDEHLSLVLSLRHLSKSQQKAFVSTFCERLYDRKADDRSAVCVVIDEASRFAPQRVYAGDEKLLGAVSDIGRQGRSSGLGLILIDQRAASINKDVLSQTEVLLVGQTSSAHDRKAIKDWIEDYGESEVQRELLASLPSLAPGEFWLCSPGWLHVFRRLRIRPRSTFDSSFTPRVGAALREPKRLARVDLAALQERLATTIERAAAEDPVGLRRRISELERELRSTREAAAVPVVETVQTPVFADGDLARLEGVVDLLGSVVGKAREAMDAVATAIARAEDLAHVADVARLTPLRPVTPAPRPGRESSGRSGHILHSPSPEHEDGRAPGAVATRTPARSIDGVTAPQQRILDALASFEALSLRSIAKHNVAIWADASPRSSGFANNLGRLRALGLIDYPSGGQVALTDAGRAAAAPPAIPLTVDDLHLAWYRKLPAPQTRILVELVDIYPQALGRGDLALRAEQSSTSSGYANNLGSLRSLGLIDYPRRGEVAATALLFPNG